MTTLKLLSSRSFFRIYVLIGGVPRSGTTMLANLIDNEMSIPFWPETHFFDIAVRNGTLDISNLPSVSKQDPFLMSAYASVTNNVGNDPIAAFRQLLSTGFDESFQVIGEKTPRHIESFDFILSNSSDFRALIIMRSCLPTIKSLTHMPWNSGHYYLNIRRWFRYAFITSRLKMKFPQRVSIIDYDEICKAPSQTVKRALQEIGISDFHNSGLRPDNFSNFDEDLEPWKTAARSKPKTLVQKRELSVPWHASAAAIAVNVVGRFLVKACYFLLETKKNRR